MGENCAARGSLPPGVFEGVTEKTAQDYVNAVVESMRSQGPCILAPTAPDVPTAAN